MSSNNGSSEFQLVQIGNWMIKDSNNTTLDQNVTHSLQLE